MKVMGTTLLAAMLTSGVLAAEEVVVKIPLLGTYSKTWPLTCPKSDKISREETGPRPPPIHGVDLQGWRSD